MILLRMFQPNGLKSICASIQLNSTVRLSIENVMLIFKMLFFFYL